jgi:uncharacterized protein YlaI
MGIEFSNRQEAACFHLRYKIDKNLDSVSKLGLITSEQVGALLLKDIYPIDEVEEAIRTCLSSEHLNLYHNVKCDFCDRESTFLEEEYNSKRTWHILLKEGERCQNCGNKIVATVKNTSRLFAVSNFKLQDKSEENISHKTTFQRMVSWLIPTTKQK